MAEQDMAALNKRMRQLTDEQRAEAIYASPNVVGFARFKQVSDSVALRDAYRKPPQTDGRA